MHLYEQKSNQREVLQKEAERHMAQLIEQMENGMIHNTKLERLTQELAERLKECSGKKVYGYLPPRVKRIVDEIVDELAKDERVGEAYDLWQTLREQLCRDYSETVPERVPLSQQRDFKTVRNMVIRETLKLSEYRLEFTNRKNDKQPISEEPESEQPVMTEKESTAEKNFAEHKNNIDSSGVGETVLRMLHQMSRIFRENSAQPAIYASMKMDKKRHRELQQKRLALGHKANDHDDSGLTHQTQ